MLSTNEQAEDGRVPFSKGVEHPSSERRITRVCRNGQSSPVLNILFPVC